MWRGPKSETALGRILGAVQKSETLSGRIFGAWALISVPDFPKVADFVIFEF